MADPCLAPKHARPGDRVELGTCIGYAMEPGDRKGRLVAILHSLDQKRFVVRCYAPGDGASALGANTWASGTNSAAVGYYSSAFGENSVALGANATADADDSVAIGANSLADRAGTVSVGNAEDGTTRQITNVAAGTEDNDAVIVSQLYPFVTALGGGASFTGGVFAPSSPISPGRAKAVAASTISSVR